MNAGGVMKGWLSNRSLLKNSVAVAHSRYIIGSFKRRWQHRSYMNKSFLSCDWGTSSFRLRLIDVGSGMPAGESVSDEGIGWANEAFVQKGYEENQRLPFYCAIIDRHIKKIKAHVKDLEDDVPVIVSGMASSNMGILELPYTLLPFSTGGEDIGVKSIGKGHSFTHELHIISGVCTATDVMRGEETQLIGIVTGKLD